MEVAWEQIDGIAIAAPAGRIDGGNADEIRRALEAGMDPGARGLILDFENVSFMSSAGLRVLRIARKLDPSGKRFAVCGLSDPIGEVFAICGFDRIIPIYASRDEAVRAAAGDGRFSPSRWWSALRSSFAVRQAGAGPYPANPESTRGDMEAIEITHEAHEAHEAANGRHNGGPARPKRVGPRPAGAQVPRLAGTLPPPCQDDVYAVRRFIRRSLVRETPGDPVSPAEFREVLLTGATGFIGRFLLRDLLQQRAGLLVHCVVRAESVEHGFDRLRRALREAGIWDESLAPRIRVVVGDLGQSRFGLGEAAFDDLCRRIDAVYHLAADTRLATSYPAVRKLNTLGLHSVLELCLRDRLKHLFQASTMAVFPQSLFAFGREFRHRGIGHQMQPDLASMKETFPLGLLGYPWSKLAAEQILLFAHRAGMPLAIFRLPRTAMSTTGFTQPEDLALKLLSAVLDHEIMPEGFTSRSGHEAVDTVSRLCAAISLNPERRHTLYHCCNPQLDDHDLGLAGSGYYPEVPYESFKRACQARGEDSPLHGHWAVLDHFEKHWFTSDRPEERLPICDRAIREDCPHPIVWGSALSGLGPSFHWGRYHRQTGPFPRRAAVSA